MATHSSILAWEIPWTEATVHGVTRVGHDLVTKPPPPFTLTSIHCIDILLLLIPCPQNPSSVSEDNVPGSQKWIRIG